MSLLKNRDKLARYSKEGRARFKQAAAIVHRDWLFADYTLGPELAKAGFVRERVYLRFGGAPEEGHSKAFGASDDEAMGGVKKSSGKLHLNGSVNENGLSVFKGRLTKDGHYVIELADSLQQFMIVGLCAGENRPAYFVRGEPLRGRDSRGACGEPLLRRGYRMESVADATIIGADRMSHALEDWNRRRGNLPGEADPVGSFA